ERAQNFPNNRSELYGKALRILLEEWAAEKRIGQNEIYQGLDTGLEQILLSEISYYNFAEDKLFFPKEEIIQQIESFPARNIHAPEKLNGDAVLNAIALQQGLLVERATNIYSFSHLTLQEYLTAQYIKEHNLIEYLVNNHLTDTRWKEVFLLVSGLMQGGADTLLSLMEQKARDYLKTSVGKDKLIPLLSWSEDIATGMTGNSKSIAKRALSNAYTYAIANAYVSAYAITNVNIISNDYAITNIISNTYPNIEKLRRVLDDLINSAREFDNLPKVFKDVNAQDFITKLETLKNEVPYNNQSIAKKKEFARRIIDTWLSTFHLSPNLLQLSEEEISEINNKYYYSNWLIIECKEAAVQVSPKAWDEIENRMLRA
ncbi:MAG: histidine kinase, partial [Cyanobacteria bacterium P01_F01_bin.143]